MGGTLWGGGRLCRRRRLRAGLTRRNARYNGKTSVRASLRTGEDAQGDGRRGVPAPLRSLSFREIAEAADRFR